MIVTIEVIGISRVVKDAPILGPQVASKWIGYFLARLNGWAVIPLAFFFSFLSVGGEFVARDFGVPAFFVHVLEGLTLLFFAASEYMEKRRASI